MKKTTFSRKFPRSSSWLSGAALCFVTALLASPAQASFHLWSLAEIYTDASGTLQFVEFSTLFGGQQFVSGQQVQVVDVGATTNHVFTLPSDLPGDSANQTFLLGTAGLEAAGGPVPDFIIPSGFLFAAGGTINFFGDNSGPYTALPIDGLNARIWGAGDALNTPQNFAGQTGTVVPEPAAWVLFGLGGTGLGLWLRRRHA